MCPPPPPTIEIVVATPSTSAWHRSSSTGGRTQDRAKNERAQGRGQQSGAAR